MGLPLPLPLPLTLPLPNLEAQHGVAAIHVPLALGLERLLRGCGNLAQLGGGGGHLEREVEDRLPRHRPRDRDRVGELLEARLLRQLQLGLVLGLG